MNNVYFFMFVCLFNETKLEIFHVLLSAFIFIEIAKCWGRDADGKDAMNHFCNAQKFV